MPTKLLRTVGWAFPPKPLEEREIRTRLPAEPAFRPPLLFVHGGLHGAWCWDEHWMPEAAGRGWPTYAVSLRGHGASEGRDQINRWKLRDYQHDVMQAVTALPEPPVLIGHAMGAAVVERVLHAYRPRGAVLLAPASGPGIALRLLRSHPSDVVRAALGRSIPARREYLFSDRLDDATARSYLGRMDRESALAQWEMLIPRPATDTDVPVLVMGAEQDVLAAPHDVSRRAQAYGTQARIFRDMGHSMMLDAGWRAPLEVMLRWIEDDVMG